MTGDRRLRVRSRRSGAEGTVMHITANGYMTVRFDGSELFTGGWPFAFIYHARPSPQWTHLVMFGEGRQAETVRKAMERQHLRVLPASETALWLDAEAVADMSEWPEDADGCITTDGTQLQCWAGGEAFAVITLPEDQAKPPQHPTAYVVTASTGFSFRIEGAYQHQGDAETFIRHYAPEDGDTRHIVPVAVRGSAVPDSGERVGT